MADFRKRIEVLIDFTTDRAARGMRSLRQEVAQADGVFGKAKAGAKGLGDQLGIGMQQAALAGGAALVGFGVKSVMAFQDTALAAGKFSEATGVAVTDSSRWIEVAGDLGIEAGTVESAFGRFAKQIKDGTSPALQQLGVDVVTAADGTTDMNATILAAIDGLNGVKDPAERAQLATQLFGRGWQGMAELVSQDADALAEKLGAVSDSQVIDEDELAKAREMRDRMDALQDSLQEVFLTVGESLVPALSDAADVLVELGDVIKALPDVPDWMNGPGGDDDLFPAIGQLRNLGQEVRQAWEDIFTDKEGLGLDGDMITEIADDATFLKDELADMADDRALQRVADQARRLGDDVDDATTEVEELYATIRNEIDVERAVLAISEAFAAVTSQAQPSRQAVLNLKEQIVDYAEAVGGIPPTKLTEVLAMIDAGSLLAAMSIINNLTAPKSVDITVRYKDGGGRFIDPNTGVSDAMPNPTVTPSTGGVTVGGVYIPPGIDFAPSSTQQVDVSGRAPMNVNVYGLGAIEAADVVATEIDRRQRGMR